MLDSHTPTHKSTFGVHYRTGSPGQLGLRVAGFPGHWVAGSQNVCAKIWDKPHPLELNPDKANSGTCLSDCSISGFQLNTYGLRAFSFAGPTAWNSLPDFIRDPTSNTDFFRCLLKTYLFARCSSIYMQRRGLLTIMRFANPRTHSLMRGEKHQHCFITIPSFALRACMPVKRVA